jgi:hypothetical protein
MRQAAFQKERPAKGPPPSWSVLLFDRLSLRIEPSLSSAIAMEIRNHTRPADQSNSASRLRVAADQSQPSRLWMDERPKRD